MEESYYQVSEESLKKEFSSDLEEGLSKREARKRLKSHGLNQLTMTSGKNIFSIFMGQFKDFMIIVLLIATIVSFLLGEITDGIAIFTIILLNAVLGFVQEYRAERSLAALKELAAPQATVIRDGIPEEIPAAELVIGDLISIKAGDRVPADIRLIEDSDISVDESLLTGESEPVAKTGERLFTRELSLARQSNMLFMGTTVMRGQARGVVVRTGSATEMGKIAEMLDEDNSRKTPLQKKLAYLGKWLVFISIIITILIVVTGILKGRSTYQMFMAGVSLAVAAIPEGLPAVVTLSLAAGVQKMIKENAIVRKLPAVETLGSATVICTDKTGTLTQNRMQIERIFVNRKIRKFSFEDKSVSKYMKKLFKIGFLSNQAEFRPVQNKNPWQRMKEYFKDSKEFKLNGDPTDKAFIEGAYQIGLTKNDIDKEFKLLKLNEFTSERKIISSLVINNNNKKKYLFAKGAPEEIIDRSSRVEDSSGIKQFTDDYREEIKQVAENMATRALRVIAVAYKPVKSNSETYPDEERLIFLGLVGLSDPPRAGVKEAVATCLNAGIRPIMVTGDHKLTAEVIGRKLGIKEIHSRVTPADKLKLVEKLQSENEIVAMTGDGINDAPAIKRADIGIAMGDEGTDVARESASIVLADDNFTTIVSAVKQGRIIYSNIRKFIRYLLSCNIGELLAIFLGVVLDLPLPLLPIQILFVNLVTDGLPALALGVGSGDDSVMLKKPRPVDETIFSGMKSSIILQGGLIGLSTILVFLLFIFKFDSGLLTARTAAFVTLVMSQLFFVFSCQSEEKSFLENLLEADFWLLLSVISSFLLLLAVLEFNWLQSFFYTVPLTIREWALIIVFAIMPTFIGDITSQPLSNK